MKLLILSLFISIVSGCIPQGFTGNGRINVDFQKTSKCYMFPFSVTCDDARQTPSFPSRMIRLMSRYGRDVRDVYLGMASVSLDQQCCDYELEYFMALKDNYGLIYSFDGSNTVELYVYKTNVENETTSTAVANKYGPFEKDYYLTTKNNVSNMTAGNFSVERIIQGYSVKQQKTEVGHPLLPLSDLVKKSTQGSQKEFSKIKINPASSVEELIFSSDDEEMPSIEEFVFLEKERERKIMAKLLTVVAIGCLGLEAVVFMISLLLFTLPSDENEIFELLDGLLPEEYETRDVSVQVTPATIANHNTRQTTEGTTQKTSTKSVPVLSKNQKVQKKKCTKSATGQKKKQVKHLPIIKENEEIDEISTSNA